MIAVRHQQIKRHHQARFIALGILIALIMLFASSANAVGPSQVAPTTISSINGGGANINDPFIQGNNWVFFAPGNGTIIEGMLIAIKNIIEDGGYNTLITIIITVGVLGMALRLGSSVQPSQIIMYLIGSWLLLYTAFALVIDIEIIDSVNDDPTAVQVHTVVLDVPAAVGLPAVAVSQVGFWLTELMESSFTLPTMTLISSGASFGVMASLPGDIAKLRFTDSYIRATLNRFIPDCIIPELSTGGIASNDLLRSENLWGLFQATAAGKFSTYSVYFDNNNPGGIVRQCNQVSASLNGDLGAQANSLIIKLSDVWHQNDSLAQMRQTIDEVMDTLQGTGVNANAATIVTQAAMINAWNDSYKNAAVSTNNNELLVALNLDQSEQIESAGWASSSTLFKDVMGYIHAILIAFSLALAPLVLLAALVPGMRMTIGKTYLSMMLWLALWYPVLSVLNFLVSSYAIRAMGEVVAWQPVAGGFSVSGLSLSTYAELALRSAKQTMLGNMLASSVPLWLWGMLKGGGYAMSSFIDKGVSGGAVAGAAAVGSVASGSGARMGVSYAQGSGGPSSEVGSAGGAAASAPEHSVQHTSVYESSGRLGSSAGQASGAIGSGVGAGVGSGSGSGGMGGGGAGPGVGGQAGGVGSPSSSISNSIGGGLAFGSGVSGGSGGSSFSGGSSGDSSGSSGRSMGVSDSSGGSGFGSGSSSEAQMAGQSSANSSTSNSSTSNSSLTDGFASNSSAGNGSSNTGSSNTGSINTGSINTGAINNGERNAAIGPASANSVAAKDDRIEKFDAGSEGSSFFQQYFGNNKSDAS